MGENAGLPIVEDRSTVAAKIKRERHRTSFEIAGVAAISQNVCDQESSATYAGGNLADGGVLQ